VDDEDMPLRRQPRSPERFVSPVQSRQDHDSPDIDVLNPFDALNEIEPQLADLQFSQEFMRGIQNATIGNTPLSDAARERLRHPLKHVPALSDDDLLSIKYFLSTRNASEQVYNDVVADTVSDAQNLGRLLSSYDQVKKLVTELTGVEAILQDMCPKSCLAYVGPFANLDECHYCKEPRRQTVTVTDTNGHPKQSLRPARQFHTIPLGPMLQGLYRSPEIAEKMSYRRTRTAESHVEARISQTGRPPILHDYIDGTLYHQFTQPQRPVIGDDDIVVMFSIDGAQLLRSKASDCWIYTWVICNLAPEERLQKVFVLPGGFIPEPDNPKNIDSFIYTGLQHANALMKEGLNLWSAAEPERPIVSRPFVGFDTADQMALSKVNGLVGVHGAHGCRLYCPQISRRKATGGDGHYYPACQCPLGPNGERLAGEGEPQDYDPAHPQPASAIQYQQNLKYLMESTSQAEYVKRRLATGITRPSLFSALSHAFPFPLCLTPDIMHLFGSNIPSLFITLWHANPRQRDVDDDPDDWGFAALRDPVRWMQLGKEIENSRVYLPSSFERAPRNLAEKINSQYKTWEYCLVFWGLFSGLLHETLPPDQYRHYCKLVFATRRYMTYEISEEEVKKAYRAGSEFYAQFERDYYARRPERLWFVRQSLHNFLHLPHETLRIGPLPNVSQYALERTIGDLGRQLRHFKDPYANFSRRGVLQCQTNVLSYMFPVLVKDKSQPPSTAEHVGNGYYLLPKHDRSAMSVPRVHGEAVVAALQQPTINLPELFLTAQSVRIARAGRLRLENGQIARSWWVEQSRDADKTRQARQVKVCVSVCLFVHRSKLIQAQQFSVTNIQGATEERIGEVQYFFQVRSPNTQRIATLALVALWSRPDPNLWDLSYNTCYSSTLSREEVVVIKVHQITSVVAMVKHEVQGAERFFLVEKPGLSILSRIPWAGPREPDEEEERDGAFWDNYWHDMRGDSDHM
jgi:hypothetical protein